MKYKLQELIDMEQFQALQDRLNEICSFPSAIIDNDGNILTATAWQDLCTKFHRQHKECKKACLKSDRYILSHIAEANPAITYRCPHGLVDNATPITIDGVHLGNFFTGQFFLEKPNLDFFRAQASKYGFDEIAYIEAVSNVPVWTPDKLNSYLFFIKGLIEVISATGLKNLRAIEAKEKIEENEKQLQAMFETAAIGIAQADTRTGQWLRVNQKMCDITGYTAAEMLALHIPDITHPEDCKTDWEQFERVVRGELPNYRMEKRYIRKDGGVVWVNVNMTVIRDAAGQPARTMATIEDITEHKQAEVALRESEAASKTLIDNSFDIIFTLDPEGIFQFVSPAWELHFGYPISEVMGKNFAPFLHPDDVAACFEYLTEVFKMNHAKTSPEFRVRHADGSWLWFIANGSSYVHSNGQRQFMGTAHNISEQKRAGERLREITSRLHLATASAKAGVWDWNLQTNEMIWDDRMFELYGLARENFSGGLEAWERALHPEDAARAIKECEAALRGERDFDSEFRIRRPDGNVIHIKANGLVLRDENGTPFRMTGLITEITERKVAEEERVKLQAQLQQAQKMESVGRLAGGVAHDFNNMLGVILGHAEMVLDEMDPAQPLFDDLREIREAAKRSANLTRQLLAFARKQTIAPKVLDLNQTIAGMLNMLNRIIGEDIQLIWQPKMNLWPVRVDPSQIDQILANLCVNARDAITGVGRIAIETGERMLDENYCASHMGVVPGEYVSLTVSDDGCGMDKETLSYIFEPFFTTKGIGKGTGLGLSTVYGIVKQNNGFINAYSEPGHGTTFTIHLPRHVSQGGQSMRREDAEEPAMRGHETLLLVEDEPAILKLAATILERQGYTVLAESSPDKAIRIAREYSGEIHLLMTDVIMPEMNGRDMAKILLSIHPHLKCLFTSGYTADVIAHHGVLDEGTHFIQKPFSVKDLAAKLREVLDGELMGIS